MKPKAAFLFFLLVLFGSAIFAQSETLKTENVILITLDGMRWQEIYGGIDSALLHNETYTPHSEGMEKMFWADTPEERRQLLLPFFWNTIAAEGQLYGNRWKGNKVNCSNSMWFSYPGYSEILCGLADDERISSNDKINNPNKTILEIINEQPAFKGKVAAFGSWDVFPYIINAERSGVPVNAGFPEKPEGEVSAQEALLYELQSQIPAEWSSVRFDAFTHHFAKLYLQEKHPRLTYISYGETDDYAHDGAYDRYIESAHRTDAFIAELWEYIQQDPFYAGKTTILITTDHGRGTQPIENWRHHGSEIPDAGQIWIAALGPDTKALGEVTTDRQSYQNQIAATVAALLGIDHRSLGKVGQPLKGVVSIK
ncbi:MAG: alkaline phosphatase family protein [Saprospiraceae bacterium]|nr:alkaline phosphatase family protein [Lewinella sp.]